MSTFEETVDFIRNYNLLTVAIRDIQSEIADMIAQMRPDLAEVEIDYCFHDAWHYVTNGGKSLNQFIAAWGRHKREEEPF